MRKGNFNLFLDAYCKIKISLIKKILITWLPLSILLSLSISTLPSAATETNFPDNISVLNTDKHVWIGSVMNGGTLSRIDSNLLTSTDISIPLFMNQWFPTVSIAVDDEYVWTGGDRGKIARVKKDDLSVTEINYTPLEIAYGLAVDDTYVWAAFSAGNFILRIQKCDLSITKIEGTNNPYGLQVDQKYVWAVNYNDSISKINKSDLSVTTIEIPIRASIISIDDLYIYLNLEDGSIAQVNKTDMSTNIIYTSDRCKFTVDNNHIWISEYNSDEVVRINKSDYSLTKIPVLDKRYYQHHP